MSKIFGPRTISTKFVGFLAESSWSKVRQFRNVCTNVEKIAESILSTSQKGSSKIVVMAGAGLSVPSGIPDFRSRGSGIYDNLTQFNLPYPEAIFDISYFRSRPEPFNAWAKIFFPGVNYHPTIGHHFIKLLDLKGCLLRLYTQNIDGLESLAGIPNDKIVSAHGSFATASCIRCLHPADIAEVKSCILSDKNPECSKCGGNVKPDIVFFGEMLPDRFWISQESDKCETDYLICIGTSLEVYPFAGIADAVPRHVPRLLINRERVGSFGNRAHDSILLGDLVETLKQLTEALRWSRDLEQLCKS